MAKRFIIFIALSLIATLSMAQDSTMVQVHPSYKEVSKAHLWLFGKNYREEWAAKVKLPIIHLSTVHGGLKPVKEGGGMQTKSLRLEDSKGKEWVLRSVEKAPDKILPDNLRGTFAVDWVDDAMSAQHPFAALVVPPLAEAAGIPHANPIIGIVAADDNLGEFADTFVGLICLLEEREPAGDTDNTPEMLSDLDKSHWNRVDGRNFLKARMLDLLLADWDRHEDQWRWVKDKSGKGKKFTGIPRDRDQVFHLSEGVFPSIAALPWVNPLFDDFEGDIPRVKYSIFKSRFLNQHPDAQLTEAEWKQFAQEFVATQTDELLEKALKRMPPEIYAIRHDELLAKLKKRRDNIPQAMSDYFKFANKTVDIKLSDKSEKITISDADDKGIRILVQSSDSDTSAIIMNNVYLPTVTEEIRIYTSGGTDSIRVNSQASTIKLRIIGGKSGDIEKGNKTEKGFKTEKGNDVDKSKKNEQIEKAELNENVITGAAEGAKVYVYGEPGNTSVSPAGRFKLHLSKDTANTQFVPSNPYNVWMPLATASLNLDDGFLLGLGFNYRKQSGFRKLPYASMQRVMLSHSFATSAYRLKYNGEWIHVAGTTDITLQALINAPDNTTNFFGTGNETILVKGHDYLRFYRTRYNTFYLDPSFRWRFSTQMSLRVGPSFQLYRMDEDDNIGRLIKNTTVIKSYDSTTVGHQRAHVGLRVNFQIDKTNSSILPSSGYQMLTDLTGYTGINSNSKAYLQLKQEFTFYQKLDSKAKVVLFNRTGGGISLGNPAFYQSMFLGGQGNLLGYLQNRFAGSHMVYNNLQTRIKLANVASYILPGQLGLTGFFDAGRVWAKNEHSNDWHFGKGGGLYFAPAGLTVFQVLAGHSKEGWYPYISLNVRI